MVAAEKKVVERTGRQENRAKYAPNLARKVRFIRESDDEVALKKMTARILDSLKNPSAIPSQVIMSALMQVRSMK